MKNQKTEEKTKKNKLDFKILRKKWVGKKGLLLIQVLDGKKCQKYEVLIQKKILF